MNVEGSKEGSDRSPIALGLAMPWHCNHGLLYLFDFGVYQKVNVVQFVMVRCPSPMKYRASLVQSVVVILN